MSRHYNRKGIFFYLLLLIAVAFIVFAAIFIYRFTDGFTKGFQTFSCEYEGKMIPEETKLTLPMDTELRFDCKDTFLMLNPVDKQCKGYTVSVYPIEAKNFTFTVNGLAKSFNSIGDVSVIFNVNRYDTYFTLKLEKNMQGILEAMYPACNIVLPNIDFSSDYYFTLSVSNKSERSWVYINLKTDL